jgi:glutaconate CoA-transferase subunit A
MAEPLGRLAEALHAIVKSGQTISIGGYFEQNVPMAMLAGIAELGVSNLTVVAAPSASIGVDYLVGTGAVTRVICPYVGFEGRGAGPALVRGVASGAVERLLCDQEILCAGLRAAAQGVTCAPVVATGSEVMERSPLVRTVVDPFTGGTLFVAQAIRVDVALLHAQTGDANRNLHYDGSRFLDLMFAQAAETVVASADTVVDISGDPGGHVTSLPGIWIDMVLEAAFGARPAASHGRYGADQDALDEYVRKETAAAGDGVAMINALIASQAGRDQ